MSDELVVEFKNRWEEADRLGMEGHRVEYALMPIIERVKAEAKAEALSEFAEHIDSFERGDHGYITDQARDRAAAIRAAAENGESNDPEV